ncbi:MAG: VOC family protein [Thermoguttaceae bacterium]
MQYLHFGVPTTENKNWAGHLPDMKVHYSDPSLDAFGIEWLKFDEGSPMHELIRTKPHVAFAVDDLDAALKGKNVIAPPYSPMPGFRFAFIEHDGLPIELTETKPVKSCCCGCGN